MEIMNIGRWEKVLGSGEGGCRMSLGVEMRGLNSGVGNAAESCSEL